MNRKTRRILEKKLGSDFPIEQFLALLGYYNHTFHLNVDEFMIFLLKQYVPVLYDEKKDLINKVGVLYDEDVHEQI